MKKTVKKEKIRIGDIFEIYLTEDKKQFFQYVADDHYLGICDVIKVIDKIYNKNVNFKSEILKEEHYFYGMTLLKYGIKDGIFIKLVGQNYKADISDALFKQKIDNFYIIENEKLQGTKTIYRLRKIGQTIDEAEVSEETYAKMEHLASKDGLSPAPAFKIGLLLRYDRNLALAYQAEFDAQFDSNGKKINPIKAKPPANIDFTDEKEIKTISLHFDIERMDRAVFEVGKIEDMLSQQYWDGHEIDLQKETAEILFFVPKQQTKKVLEEFTNILNNKSPKDIVIRVNNKKVATIKKVGKLGGFFSRLFNY